MKLFSAAAQKFQNHIIRWTVVFLWVPVTFVVLLGILDSADLIQKFAVPEDIINRLVEHRYALLKFGFYLLCTYILIYQMGKLLISVCFSTGLLQKAWFRLSIKSLVGVPSIAVGFSALMFLNRLGYGLSEAGPIVVIICLALGAMPTFLLLNFDPLEKSDEMNRSLYEATLGIGARPHIGTYQHVISSNFELLRAMMINALFALIRIVTEIKVSEALLGSQSFDFISYANAAVSGLDSGNFLFTAVAITLIVGTGVVFSMIPSTKGDD